MLDIISRLKATLPARWFADDTPGLDAVMAGMASAWGTIQAQLHQARVQARLMTATGGFLDLIAGDFFGAGFRRRLGQGDAAYRQAIARELVRERATRAALSGVLSDLTGNVPKIFEPARVADTGAYGHALGYGVAGGWGSFALPFQSFVTIARPTGGGIPGLPGWRGPFGWGVAGSWGDLGELESQVADADIYAAAAAVVPAASIAWVRIV